AVIPFAVGQPEQALLEDWIFAIPQRESEAEVLSIVGDAGQPVLAPTIGAGARLIMGEEIPRIAVFAIIFADRSPLALRQIRTPLLPGSLLLARLFKPDLFGVHETSRCFLDFSLF